MISRISIYNRKNWTSAVRMKFVVWMRYKRQKNSVCTDNEATVGFFPNPLFAGSGYETFNFQRSERRIGCVLKATAKYVERLNYSFLNFTSRKGDKIFYMN